MLKVCNDGKSILDSIQSSQSTSIGQMEFKTAASHILDIVYEVVDYFYFLLFQPEIKRIKQNTICFHAYKIIEKLCRKNIIFIKTV